MAMTADVVARVLDALYLSDPELDTSIGTPLRKVIDAVSDQIAQASTDSYLIDYSNDIDSKTGGDLDDFVATWGMSRQVGTRATGTLTFSRSATIANVTAVIIPAGTQAVTGTIPQQTFQTALTTTMDVGQTSVDIPSQAVTVGPDSNILANTPLQMVSTVQGVTNVSNAAAFVGGGQDETDAQLRSRWKSSSLRNLAGTDAMYRGIALQVLANNSSGSFGVAAVNILGSTSHNVEQIQMAASPTGTQNQSSLTTSSYFVSGSVFVTDQNGAVYNPLTQYTVTVNNNANPATLTVAPLGTTVGMPDGVYNVEYDYVPLVSRNDPFNTRWNQGVVNNRVDVYVNGQTPVAQNQPVYYVNTLTFNNTAGDPLNRTKFVSPSGSVPANGDVFIPLGYVPVLSLPTTITASGGPYSLGANYDIIHQDDAFGYSPTSLGGIWWKTTTNGTNPPNNTQLHSALPYTSNSTPVQVRNALGNWRLLGTDVQVHAGKTAYLTLNFVIVYDRSVNISTVNTNIQTALDSYLKRLGFNAAVQISDIVQIAHNVAGVDNIRIAASTDNAVTYGVQLVQSNGTVISTYNVSGRPTDVYFDERTYPLLYSINYIVRARNTFRT
jgi:uncharacterized phage protein gp47/JayE